MRVSFAEDHNIPPGPNDPRITPRIIVIHTMAGFIEGAQQRFKTTGLEAHLGFALDGRVWQWRDTDWQADAQGAGNDYCISFEFEDMGNCMLPFSEPQKRNFYRACAELMPRYGMPARLVQRTSEHGFGYHRQFPEWNPHNHACPCDTRQDQLIHELIPTLQRGIEEVDEVVIIRTTPGPFYAYYEASGIVRVIHTGETAVIKKIHAASGKPAREVNLTTEEHAEFKEFLARPEF